MAHPTITDVARMAGVAVSTVSRVLNDSGYVSEPTRRKVLDAAAQLDFQPNHIARSLVQKSTKLIGMVISDILNPFYSQLARAIENASEENGYSVVLCNTNESVEKEKQYLKILLAKRVDGIIMAGGRGLGDAYNLHLYDAAVHVPLVLSNECIDHENIYSVCCDKEAGAYEMTNYLIGLGHRDIVHIAGYRDYKPTWDRIGGFRRAMDEKGLPVDDDMIVFSDYHPAGGCQAMLELIKRTKPPTAVFASNDLMAIGALKALRENGLSVPGQVSVAGSDNIAFNELVSPALTTICHNVEELGRVSVSVLLKLMKGGGAPKTTMIDTRLVIRQSCGICR